MLKTINNKIQNIYKNYSIDKADKMENITEKICCNDCKKRNKDCSCCEKFLENRDLVVLIDYINNLENKLKKNYDDYIVFLLGGDTFSFCEKLRNKAYEFGMDGIYDMSIYIAQKFAEYDEKNKYYLDKYAMLERFLFEYENELINYMDNGKDFEIKGENNEKSLQM